MSNGQGMVKRGRNVTRTRDGQGRSTISDNNPEMTSGSQALALTMGKLNKRNLFFLGLEDGFRENPDVPSCFRRESFRTSCEAEEFSFTSRTLFSPANCSDQVEAQDAELGQ